METFRCPTCLFVLADPGQKRCPSCHKRLRRRGQPIVLGDKAKFGTNEPVIDLVVAERAEPAVARPAVTSSSVFVPPVYTGPVEVPVVNEPAVRAAVAREPEIEHTTIFEPSQFDPEMRQVLDDLYRKARSASDD